MKKTKLYLWPSADGLESSSPYCMKVLWALRYQGLPFELKYIGSRMPSWAKRGKLPVAVVNGQFIEDSTNILRELDRLAPAERRLYPDADLQLADTLLLEDWADECFTYNISYYRWAVLENYKPFSAQVLAGIPFPARKIIAPLVRRSVLNMLKENGIAHQSEVERQERFREGLSILERRLKRTFYLTGNNPTAADFAVFPSIEMMVRGKIPELLPAIQRSSEITYWLRRMREAVCENTSSSTPA